MAREQAVKLAEETNRQEHVSRSERTEVVPEVIDEMGVISEHTKVVGNIVTKGHIGIAGIVEGNVDAKGTVIIKGTVKGNITCQNLMIEKGKVVSDIVCDGQIAIKDGSIVTGHIQCKDITVGGTINGEILCQNQAGFSYGAVANADITAKKLVVEPGVKINGQLRMK